MQHSLDEPGVAGAPPWAPLTDEAVADWNLGKLDGPLAIFGHLAEQGRVQDAAILLYDVVAATVAESRATVDATAAFLQQVLGNGGQINVHSLVLDTIDYFPANTRSQELLRALPLDPSLQRFQLEPALLTTLGLVDSMFGKRIIRTNTNMTFRQRRFNLLREESEGYAKLVVEVHTASYATNNLELVDETVANIVALIGYFHLDPNRALDVILDILSVNLVAQSRFYLALLRRSPWWPETPAVCPTPADIAVGGNALAATLLGFKLRTHTELGEAPPDSFIMMIAVLIKEGFVCLADIYPHLTPTDDDVEAERERWSIELEERTFRATASALALAAPLADDGPGGGAAASAAPADAPAAEAAPSKDARLPLQKVTLLSDLLAVGALGPALYLLGKFPFLAGPYPEIADMINRITAHALEPFYAHIRPFRVVNQSAADNQRKLPSEMSKAAPLTLPRAPNSRRVLSPLKKPDQADMMYRFFYETWASDVAPIASVDELVAHSDRLLRFSGTQIHRDLTLLTKLTRVVTHYIRKHKQQSERGEPVDDAHGRDFWLAYFRTYIFPCLSLIDYNPGIMHEISQFMFCYPYPVRYSLYGEWYTVLLRNQPDLKMAAAKAEKQTKNILKRLSKTNVKEMMRQLAKVSYGNPLTTFMVLVGQVESYDNLSELVIEAARYFTAMGWDALPLVIMMQLTSGRATVQGDGVTERKWLQSLSSFSAKLCRQYHLMDPTPLLHYLQKQLYKSNSSDILILQNLLTEMAGIVPFTNLNDSQLEGLSCGPTLRHEVLTSIKDRRHTSLDSGNRLLQCLISQDMVTELLVLLSHQYRSAIFTMPEYAAHVKILGSRYDDLAIILNQYIEMLNFFLLSGADGKTRFDSLIMSIPDLCNEFGVDPVVAFYLWRERLGLEVREYDDVQWKKSAEERERAKAEQQARAAGEAAGAGGTTDVKMEDAAADADVAMDDAESDEEGQVDEAEAKAEATAAAEPKTEAETEAETVPETVPAVKKDADADAPAAADAPAPHWHPLLQPIIDNIASVIPGDEWLYLNKGLYVTFWQLSLYDIQMPMTRYQQEQSRLREAMALPETDNTPAGVRARKAERDKILKVITKLQGESRQQMAHYEHTRQRLRAEKDFWFHTDPGHTDTIVELMEASGKFIIHCVLPRAMFSPMDALYCARFIKMLHSYGTSNFSTLTFFEKLLADGQLFATFASCTPTEAENLGRFLYEIFSELNRWRKDPRTYQRDGQGRREIRGEVTFYPGLSLRWDASPAPAVAAPAPAPTANPSPPPTPTMVLMEYDDYRRVLFKWHNRLRQAIADCLESTDYMHRRNIIIILKHMSKVFPLVRTHGKSITDKVEQISKSETREDLKLAATTLLGILKRQSKDWIDLNAFQAPSDAKGRAGTPSRPEPAAKAAETVE
ncbi:transcription factor/nuclear export subunit protein 2-domain-containing protein, partial [Dipodascopsis tothii]|uniref:transcription factor/nuclear export subunit protein 2-domain-containing protein n=1 Tax=Dipodascopsis tothii TaxID=44089 RepID=UPI0034CE1E58